MISHVDITDMHVVQRTLSHQASHDALTGLPNRHLLTDRLSQALRVGARRGREVGVACLDLDRFKRVNDSFGHPAGDALLVQVAERLSRQMRASDTLARLSGGEFVVVWQDIDSAEDATLLCQRLAESLKDPFDLGVATVDISASIGAVIGRPHEGVEDLLKAADAAMYEAKRRGGGRIRVFNNESRQGVEEVSATEVDLRAALSRSELVVHYQPVIDLASGAAVAVEALVRWQHPKRGLLPPAHFIPIAEASGLVVPLDRWVLERACRDAAAFSGLAEGIDVAVNLSARHLGEPDILKHVSEALLHSGLAADRLLLEVTESAVMEDAEAAAAALDALSQMGVRIAIDDFGTGYSSLLYVRRFPVSALKLDRAFVSGIDLNPGDEAICGSVVSLAHAVGATSIAEGVETMEQYAALGAFGCQQAQGYLWSPAVAVEELADVLLTCAAVPLLVSTATAGEKQKSDAITRAVAVAADKTAEGAESARVARAAAVTLAADTVALTAAKTARAVRLQAEASAAKVATAASDAATALADSLSEGDPAAAVTAFRLAATVSAAAEAKAEETALAAALVARAVAAAASQTALTASAAAVALEAEVASAAAGVRAVVAETARPTSQGPAADEEREPWLAVS